DGLPPRLDEDAAARPEDALVDGRLDARALVDRLRVEDGEETLRDEVVDLALVVAHRAEVVVGLRRDDRVVVGDLLVVDDARERQLLEAEDVVRSLGVLAVAADELDRRADLLDQVARQEAGARARVRDRLPLLVQLLRRGERPPRGAAVEPVPMALA